MALLDRFQGLRELHKQVKACGADPFGVKMDRVLSTTEALIEGRRTILCGTNNYLGLTFDADCVAAAQQALADYGTISPEDLDLISFVETADEAVAIIDDWEAPCP